MKHLFKGIFTCVLSLYLTQMFITGLHLGGDFTRTILTAGAFLYVLSSILKPVFNLFLLPINLLTLGTLRWLVNVVNLYILTKLVPQIQISAFDFSGGTVAGLDLPAFSFGYVSTFVIASITISVFIDLIHWIIE